MNIRLLNIITCLFITAFIATSCLEDEDLEFEYSYFNGDLDIDKIMAKQSRKRVFSTDMESMIVVAPAGSIELQPYKQLKGIDYSSNTGNGKVYELVTNCNGRKVSVLCQRYGRKVLCVCHSDPAGRSEKDDQDQHRRILIWIFEVEQ